MTALIHAPARAICGKVTRPLQRDATDDSEKSHPRGELGSRESGGRRAGPDAERR